MIALHLCTLVTAGVNSGPSCEELLLWRWEEEVGAIWPERNEETVSTMDPSNLGIHLQFLQITK